jgi:hypothetical protein
MQAVIRKRSALWAIMASGALGMTMLSPARAAPASTESVAQINTSKETPQRQAAERGLFELSNRLTNMPGHSPSIFALDDYQALRRARIGMGFAVNLVNPQALLSGKSISESASPTSEWRFVVTVDDKPVGLITVAPMDGRWTMVSAGASGLAGELSRAASQFQQDPKARLRFIRSQQGVTDLLEVASGKAPPRYVPLLSARMMLSGAATSPQPVASARLAPSDQTNATAPLAPLSESDLAPALRESIKRGLIQNSLPSIAH